MTEQRFLKLEQLVLDQLGTRVKWCSICEDYHADGEGCEEGQGICMTCKWFPKGHNVAQCMRVKIKMTMSCDDSCNRWERRP